MSAARQRRGEPYFAYGVAIQSEWPLELPRLTIHDEPLAHVHVAEMSSEAHGEGDASNEWFESKLSDDGMVSVRWGRLLRCVVSPNGQQIACRLLEEGSIAVVRNFLLVQILSYALVRQGFEPIHAAVLDVNRIGVALAGECTYGKSTLAAALLAAGHRLLADDLLLIDERRGRLRAQIGSGRIRLNDDSAVALLPKWVPGERLQPGSTKRSFALPTTALGERVDLEHMFVLQPPRGESSGITIEPLSCAQRFDALLRNSFNIRVLDGGRLERQFEFAARIAPRIRGWALQYPRELSVIGAVASAVIDVARASSTAAGMLNEEVGECR